MEKEKRVLKSGYTTGVHASLAFARALEAVITTRDDAYCITNKSDNDDLDVTKNCEIIVKISYKKDKLTINPIFHNSQDFIISSNKMHIFAGLGLGIVTKKGLKIAPDFPAINPVPLQNMQRIFEEKTKDEKNLELFCTVCITNGEEIAKQTANAKVGVMGGISILGTKGVVKPVSSTAYIDSIETEIGFAVNNDYDPLIFTLGNSALKIAREKYDDVQIIEVANFVYASIEVAEKVNVKKIIFVCGIGKMTKVYQGFKNTHNRFGSIDLIQLKKDINENLNYEVDIESTKTVKGISLELEKINLDMKFYEMISIKANKQIKKWFPNSDVEAIILEQNEVIKW